jgi:hypothetical protein
MEKKERKKERNKEIKKGGGVFQKMECPLQWRKKIHYTTCPPITLPKLKQAFRLL